MIEIVTVYSLDTLFETKDIYVCVNLTCTAPSKKCLSGYILVLSSFVIILFNIPNNFQKGKKTSSVIITAETVVSPTG